MQPFYDPRITPKTKKYSVYTPKGRLIHFGQRGYQQYHDKIGRYSSQDHHDPDRRRLYLARASYIRNKRGQFTANDPESPNYYSIRFLW